MSPPPSRKTGASMRYGRAYQGAFEAVVAVAVGTLGGAFLDSRLGTTPWLLVAGLIFGFGAFVLRLMRLMNRLAKDTKESSGRELR